MLPTELRVSLVPVVKACIQNYPSDTLVMEFIQNADDAGASMMHFVIDLRNHPPQEHHLYRGETPLSPALLAQYSRPSLLVWNNSLFQQKDFQSLCEIMNSQKALDNEKTGRFGQGFNVCYHVTDTPSVLSNYGLLFLDPVGEYTERKCLQGFEVKDVQPLLQPWKSAFPSSPEGRGGVGSEKSNQQQYDTYPATVFRLPFRNVASPIRETPFTSDNTMQLFQSFQSFAQVSNPLLFLKNVRSLEFSIIHADGTLQSLYSLGIEPASPRLFPPSPLNIRFWVESDGNSKYNNNDTFWLVATETPTDSSEAFQEFRTAKDFVTKPPKGSVAVKVALSSSDTICRKAIQIRGAYYATLPVLDQDPASPVHVNGQFELQQSRREFQRTRRGKSASGTRDVTSEQWNQVIHTHAVVPAYVAAIKYLIEHHFEDVQSVLPGPTKEHGHNEWVTALYHQLHVGKVPYLLPRLCVEEALVLPDDDVVASGIEWCFRGKGLSITRPAVHIRAMLREYLPRSGWTEVNRETFERLLNDCKGLGTPDEVTSHALVRFLLTPSLHDYGYQWANAWPSAELIHLLLDKIGQNKKDKLLIRDSHGAICRPEDLYITAFMKSCSTIPRAAVEFRGERIQSALFFKRTLAPADLHVIIPGVQSIDSGTELLDVLMGLRNSITDRKGSQEALSRLSPDLRYVVCRVGLESEELSLCSVSECRPYLEKDLRRMPCCLKDVGNIIPWPKLKMTDLLEHMHTLTDDALIRVCYKFLSDHFRSDEFVQTCQGSYPFQEEDGALCRDIRVRRMRSAGAPLHTPMLIDYTQFKARYPQSIPTLLPNPSFLSGEDVVAVLEECAARNSVDLAVRVLHNEDVTAALNLKKALVPTRSGQFVPLETTVFLDWSETKANVPCDPLHDKISKDAAVRCGIEMYSQRFASKLLQSAEWEQQQQHITEDVVARIRKLLDAYPNHTLFREAAQNADDAGATEVEFCLDLHHYKKDTVLPEMEEFQGPALVITNNGRAFTPEDYVSLRTLTGSKKDEKEHTGHFGVGRCAFFHIADVVLLHSGGDVVVMDPTQRVNKKHSFLRYLREDLTGTDHLEPFQEYASRGNVVFRLPLRSSKGSKLGLSCSEDTAQDLMRHFSQEASKHLLFTRNLRKITLRFGGGGEVLVIERTDEIPQNPYRIITGGPNRTEKYYVEQLKYEEDGVVAVAAQMEPWDHNGACVAQHYVTFPLVSSRHSRLHIHARYKLSEGRRMEGSRSSTSRSTEAMIDCLGTVFDNVLHILQYDARALSYVYLDGETDSVLSPLQPHLIASVLRSLRELQRPTLSMASPSDRSLCMSAVRVLLREGVQGADELRALPLLPVRYIRSTASGSVVEETLSILDDSVLFLPLSPSEELTSTLLHIGFKLVQKEIVSSSFVEELLPSDPVRFTSYMLRKESRSSWSDFSSVHLWLQGPSIGPLEDAILDIPCFFLCCDGQHRMGRELSLPPESDTELGRVCHRVKLPGVAETTLSSSKSPALLRKLLPLEATTQKAYDVLFSYLALPEAERIRRDVVFQLYQGWNQKQQEEHKARMSQVACVPNVHGVLHRACDLWDSKFLCLLPSNEKVISSAFVEAHAAHPNLVQYLGLRTELSLSTRLEIANALRDVQDDDVTHSKKHLSRVKQFLEVLGGGVGGEENSFHDITVLRSIPFVPTYTLGENAREVNTSLRSLTECFAREHGSLVHWAWPTSKVYAPLRLFRHPTLEDVKASIQALAVCDPDGQTSEAHDTKGNVHRWYIDPCNNVKPPGALKVFVQEGCAVDATQCLVDPNAVQARPFYYSASDLGRELCSLLLMFGAKHSLKRDILIELTREETLCDDDRQKVIEEICKTSDDHDLGSRVFVSTTHHGLQRASDAYWIDVDTDPASLSERPIASRLSQIVARTLGVLSLKEEIRASEPLEFRQSEPLRQRLKNILTQSLTDPQVAVFEYLQNADDAGSSKFVIVLDERTARDDKKLAFKELCKTPALCFYNDRTFTEKDIENVTRLGWDSPDKHKTGRFGIGLNSGYTFSDCIQWASGGDFFLFDPLNVAHTKDGSRCKLKHEFSAQWQLFGGVCGVPAVTHGRLDGTYFRLSLRQSKRPEGYDRISDKLWNEDHLSEVEEIVKGALKSLEKAMLFLRHVTQVEFHHVDSEGRTVPEHSVTLRKIPSMKDDHQVRVSVSYSEKASTTKTWTTFHDPESDVTIVAVPKSVKKPGSYWNVLPPMLESTGLPFHISAPFPVQMDRKAFSTKESEQTLLESFITGPVAELLARVIAAKVTHNTEDAKVDGTWTTWLTECLPEWDDRHEKGNKHYHLLLAAVAKNLVGMQPLSSLLARCVLADQDFFPKETTAPTTATTMTPPLTLQLYHEVCVERMSHHLVSAFADAGARVLTEDLCAQHLASYTPPSILHAVAWLHFIEKRSGDWGDNFRQRIATAKLIPTHGGTYAKVEDRKHLFFFDSVETSKEVVPLLSSEALALCVSPEVPTTLRKAFHIRSADWTDLSRLIALQPSEERSVEVWKFAKRHWDDMLPPQHKAWSSLPYVKLVGVGPMRCLKDGLFLQNEDSPLELALLGGLYIVDPSLGDLPKDAAEILTVRDIFYHRRNAFEEATNTQRRELFHLAQMNSIPREKLVDLRIFETLGGDFTTLANARQYPDDATMFPSQCAGCVAQSEYFTSLSVPTETSDQLLEKWLHDVTSPTTTSSTREEDLIRIFTWLEKTEARHLWTHHVKSPRGVVMKLLGRDVKHLCILPLDAPRNVFPSESILPASFGDCAYIKTFCSALGVATTIASDLWLKCAIHVANEKSPAMSQDLLRYMARQPVETIVQFPHEIRDVPFVVTIAGRVKNFASLDDVIMPEDARLVPEGKLAIVELPIVKEEEGHNDDSWRNIIKAPPIPLVLQRLTLETHESPMSDEILTHLGSRIEEIMEGTTLSHLFGLEAWQILAERPQGLKEGLPVEPHLSVRPLLYEQHGRLLKAFGLPRLPIFYAPLVIDKIARKESRATEEENQLVWGLLKLLSMKATQEELLVTPLHIFDENMRLVDSSTLSLDDPEGTPPHRVVPQMCCVRCQQRPRDAEGADSVTVLESIPPWLEWFESLSRFPKWVEEIERMAGQQGVFDGLLAPLYYSPDSACPKCVFDAPRVRIRSDAIMYDVMNELSAYLATKVGISRSEGKDKFLGQILKLAPDCILEILWEERRSDDEEEDGDNEGGGEDAAPRIPARRSASTERGSQSPQEVRTIPRRLIAPSLSQQQLSLRATQQRDIVPLLAQLSQVMNGPQSIPVREEPRSDPDLARRYMAQAKEDIQAADCLVQNGFRKQAMLQYQQAAEKASKAFYMMEGQSDFHSHRVRPIRGLTAGAFDGNIYCAVRYAEKRTREEDGPHWPLNDMLEKGQRTALRFIEVAQEKVARGVEGPPTTTREPQKRPREQDDEGNP